MDKISTIIYAYNDENTIRDVLTTVSECIIVNEIIIINDGSTDNTHRILEELEKQIAFCYIPLNYNMGKDYAITEGVKRAYFGIILLIDADVKNLCGKQLIQLVNPLIGDNADMVIARLDNKDVNKKLNLFKSYSGLRTVFKKDILEIIHKTKNIGFAYEILINTFYQSKGKRIKYIVLEGLKHPTKLI